MTRFLLHPGFHLNPHVPTIVLLAALGFAILAWGSMVTYLLVLKVRARRAKDRLIRARLNLADAIAERTYWQAKRDYWVAVRDLLVRPKP